MRSVRPRPAAAALLPPPPVRRAAAALSLAAPSLLLAAAPATAAPLDAVEAAVAAAGPAGPAVFSLAYAAAVVALVPAAPLTLAAGALFGPLLGTAVVSAGATAGATAAYALARGAAAPTLRARLAGTPAWDTLTRILASAGAGGDGAAGARLVLLLRLSPLVPFSASNYGLGLLAPTIPLPAFAAATAAGSLVSVLVGWAGWGVGKNKKWTGTDFVSQNTDSLTTRNLVSHSHSPPPPPTWPRAQPARPPSAAAPALAARPPGCWPWARPPPWPRSRWWATRPPKSWGAVSSEKSV